MSQAPRMSESVQKRICEYFDGDDQESVYGYRTRSELVTLYTSRFGDIEFVSAPSRWMVCSDTIDYLYGKGKINDFFTVMLSLRNVSKELKEINQVVAAEKRRNAIADINRILLRELNVAGFYGCLQQ